MTPEVSPDPTPKVSPAPTPKKIFTSYQSPQKGPLTCEESPTSSQDLQQQFQVALDQVSQDCITTLCVTTEDCDQSNHLILGYWSRENG